MGSKKVILPNIFTSFTVSSGITNSKEILIKIIYKWSLDNFIQIIG